MEKSILQLCKNIDFLIVICDPAVLAFTHGALLSPSTASQPEPPAQPPPHRKLSVTLLPGRSATALNAPALQPSACPCPSPSAGSVVPLRATRPAALTLREAVEAPPQKSTDPTK